MAGAWKALVLVVSLSVVSCVPRRRQLRYDDIVTRALQIYNDGRQGMPLFRLLEAIPPALNSTTRIPLNFRIKETVCISTRQPQQQPQECAFREGGEERTCTGEFSRRLSRQFLILTCDRDCGNQPQVNRVSSFNSPEDDVPEAEATKLPAVVNDLYERAKYSIISDILQNF